ncbi:hypothetical protein R1flu_016859 [Riccia fluitans]|uniref:Early light-induced protein n=1 Tax=Riccia fluitans TaxID=41844 RepID=A0ABD1YNB2_9MARC
MKFKQRTKPLISWLSTFARGKVEEVAFDCIPIRRDYEFSILMVGIDVLSQDPSSKTKSLRSAPLASCSGRSVISSLGYRSLGAPRILISPRSNQYLALYPILALSTHALKWRGAQKLERGASAASSLSTIDRFGAAPETINGRLAIIGIFWAAIAEKISGLTVFDQLYTQGTGLVFYVTLVPLIAYASIVPVLNGESTDARSFGPFTARAERWNGRLAMIGFLSLLLTESFIHAPVFTNFS